MKLTERLRELRLNAEMTLTDVAKHIGTSLAFYSYVENGTRVPPLAIIVSLADFYNVSVDWLLGRTERKER